MIAKRRSFVTLISYQAPPLKKSGLYGEYQELKETIAEYRESLQSAPERSQDLLEQIGRLVSRCHLEYAGNPQTKICQNQIWTKSNPVFIPMKTV